MRRAFVLAVLLVISYSAAGFVQETESEKIIINPKQVTEATFRIVQSGTLEISGSIRNANITLHIPQDSESVKVVAEKYSFISDQYGNKLVFLEWANPSGAVSYRIDTVVKNGAFYAADKAISVAKDFTGENSQMVFTPALRELAFPYEKSLERVAELTALVYGHVDYDLSLVGQLKPSDWVHDNRRGVCVEFSNLLGSLLRISGIPTRYIVGYAYSAVQNKLIGHTWLEVLAADGSWIPFDPTWLEGGYLDATHIKTAVREDANQTELLSYVGIGKINWIKNTDEIEMLGYKTGNVTAAAVEASRPFINDFGYIKTNLKTSSCTIVSINASSCLSGGSSMLDIYDRERKFWACDSTELYWFFKPRSGLKENFIYTCPVVIYDQTGLQEAVNVTVSGARETGSVAIIGPGKAAINEAFSLTAEADGNFIFYSPQLGRNSGKTWSLKLGKPGEYKFYLYSNGALAQKTVSIVKEKEFNITVDVPRNATLGGTFLANVTVKNLAPRQKPATVRVFYDNATESRQLSFKPGETKAIIFNFTAFSEGNRKVEAVVEADGATGYSSSLYVYNPVVKAWWERIIGDVISFMIELVSKIKLL